VTDRRGGGPRRFELLALDIDGTLVDRSLEITPRNLDALQQATAAGIRVVLASGRMYRSALPYAEAIGTSEPLICYQGAVVRSRGGEILREWPLGPEAARTAVRFSREHRVHVNLYQDDQFYVESMGWGAERYAAVAQMEPQLVPDLMDLAARGSTKVVFVDQPARLHQLMPAMRRAFEPESRVTFSLPEFLEVVEASVSKAAALQFICELEGVDPARVIAAGDAPNDVEMLRFAGLAVVPTSAFPEALAEADETIPPPDQDGMAALVERHLLG
jgi:Cof subfamily protein (haloacid dehalogenase superfamily)